MSKTTARVRPNMFNYRNSQQQKVAEDGATTESELRTGKVLQGKERHKSGMYMDESIMSFFLNSPEALKEYRKYVADHTHYLRQLTAISKGEPAPSVPSRRTR